MKKFIILIASLFSFFIFSALALIALTTNQYGININSEQLLPTFEITVLDENTIDKTLFNDYYSPIVNSQPVTIINNTDQDINIYQNSSYYPDLEGNYETDYYFESLLTSIQGNTITLTNGPTEYDAYWLNDFYIPDTEPYINIQSYEYYDSATAPESIYEQNTITVKKGQSYAIKLPE